MTYIKKTLTEVAVTTGATSRPSEETATPVSVSNLPKATVSTPLFGPYIRLADLASTPGKPGLLPVGPAAVWRWSRHSDKTGFPRPFRLGASVTVWSRAAVEAFIAKRATGAADEMEASI